MGYDDISDYDYVCRNCGKAVEAREFFCGMPLGLPDECQDCEATDFIPAREAAENERINWEDAVREDERLYGLRGPW